jgi:hypothetical protein
VTLVGTPTSPWPVCHDAHHLGWKIDATTAKRVPIAHSETGRPEGTRLGPWRGICVGIASAIVHCADGLLTIRHHPDQLGGRDGIPRDCLREATECDRIAAREDPSYSHLVGGGRVSMAQAGGKGIGTAKDPLALGAGSDTSKLARKPNQTKALKHTSTSAQRF